MRIFQIALLLMLFTGCKNNAKDANTSEEKENITVKNDTEFPFYVGTYTNGDSKGIYKYTLSADGKLSKDKLVASSENPSFLAFSKDRNYLLAVNENEVGTVSSFKIQPDTLQFINKSLSGGAHPCFVVVNENGFIVTANYSSGTVGLLEMDDDGRVSDLLFTNQHTGKGTHERQDASHAHSVWLAPTQNDVVEVDLGTNELWFSTINSEGKTLEAKQNQKLTFAEGTGPRHMTFHPNGKWAYVFGELNNTVVTLALDEQNQFKVLNTYTTLPTDFSGENTGADIHISSDGKFLYASNRGHNSIAVFEVLEEGKLQLKAHTSVRGKGPRNFSLAPNEDYLLVANQYTNNIISFKRDSKTGLLTFVDEIEAPTPVCILFE
ncbi:lactonase family protein [Joostella sp. CR20]|uniref:lactonase family protein n=1 Tax=Joostella sp. CR20 TaxID=2804312 RepID=UPI00313B9317